MGFLVNPYRFGVTSPDPFEPTMEESAWTEVGTVFIFTGNLIDSNQCGNNVNEGYYYTGGITQLSNEKWSVRFSYKMITEGGTVESGYPIVLSSTTAKPLGTIDGCMINQDNGRHLVAQSSKGTTRTNSGNTSVLVSGTQYYIQLQRTSTTNLEIKMFTDDTFETQFGSTQNCTVASDSINYDQLQVRSADNGGSAAPQCTFLVGAIEVYDDWNFD